jgi:hypothetical protein
MQELVVPKSMPITLAINLLLDICIRATKSSDGAKVLEVQRMIFITNILRQFY